MDPTQTCSHCSKTFYTHPGIIFQQYCSQPLCQKARKKKWHQKKLAEDADYRRNQAAAQADWCSRNPDYWRKYRERHPEYAKRNRQLQQARNQRRRQKREVIAKMDAAVSGKSLENKPFGTFQLIPVGPDGVIAKMDAVMVEIREMTSLFVPGQQ